MVSIQDPVQFWHADVGSLYKYEVGVNLWGWNFRDKQWFPLDADGRNLFSRRQEATEVDQISEEEMTALLKQAPVKM